MIWLSIALAQPLQLEDWSFEQIDAGGQVNFEHRHGLSQGPNGVLCVAFGADDALVVSCSGAGGVQWTSTTIPDGAGRAGVPATAVGPDGSAHVAHHGDGALWYSTNSSGSWQTEVLAEGAVPTSTALHVAADGTPHVLFIDERGDPALVHGEPAPGGWVFDYVFEDAEGIAPWPDLAVDSTGGVHVAVVDQDAGELLHVEQDGLSWSSQWVADVNSGTSWLGVEVDDQDRVSLAWIDRADTSILNHARQGVTTAWVHTAFTSSYSLEGLGFGLDDDGRAVLAAVHGGFLFVVTEHETHWFDRDIYIGDVDELGWVSAASADNPRVLTLQEADDRRLVVHEIDGWDFTPTTLARDLVSGAYPSVADGGDGRVVVAFHRFSGTNGLAAVRETAQGWERYDLGVPDLGASPSAAAHDDGSRYVLFNVQRALRLARFSGGSWDLETLDDMFGGYGGLVVDDSGALHYVISTSTSHALTYGTNESGQWERASVGLTANNRPRIAVEGDGTPHACAWSSSEHLLRYAASTSDGWVDEVVEDTSGWPLCDISVDSSGQAHMVWSNRYAVRAASGWVIEDIPGTEVSKPAIAVESGGTVHAAWLDGDAVIYGTQTDGQWSTLELGEPGSADPDYGPDLALDDYGGVTVAWAMADGGGVMSASDPTEGFVIDEGCLSCEGGCQSGGTGPLSVLVGLFAAVARRRSSRS